MRHLTTILIAACSFQALAQDTSDVQDNMYKLDTMPGNTYGEYSNETLDYVEKVYVTRVGNGLCNALAEGFKKEYGLKAVKKSADSLVVGDIIVFQPGTKFIGATGEVYSELTSEHLVIFLGWKDTDTMLVAEQNVNRSPVIVSDINVKKIKGKPYKVYGYKKK